MPRSRAVEDGVTVTETIVGPVTGKRCWWWTVAHHMNSVLSLLSCSRLDCIQLPIALTQWETVDRNVSTWDVEHESYVCVFSVELWWCSKTFDKCDQVGHIQNEQNWTNHWAPRKHTPDKQNHVGHVEFGQQGTTETIAGLNHLCRSLPAGTAEVYRGWPCRMLPTVH